MDKVNNPKINKAKLTRLIASMMIMILVLGLTNAEITIGGNGINTTNDAQSIKILEIKPIAIPKTLDYGLR